MRDVKADSSRLDESALPALLLHHTPGLMRCVRSKIPEVLRCSVSAEDILQDVWVAAYRGISQFRSYQPHAFERWITTITENKLIDAVKATRMVKRGGGAPRINVEHHLESSFLDVFGRAVDGRCTPSRDLSSKEAIRAVRMAIDSLSDDRRQAVWLKDIEGHTVADVARKMNKSHAAVRGLLFNGRLELRDRIGSAASFFTDALSTEVAPRDGLPR